MGPQHQDRPADTTADKAGKVPAVPPGGYILLGKKDDKHEKHVRDYFSQDKGSKERQQSQMTIGGRTRWSGQASFLGYDQWEPIKSESEGLSLQAEGAACVKLPSVPSLPEVHLRQKRASTVRGGRRGLRERGRQGDGWAVRMCSLESQEEELRLDSKLRSHRKVSGRGET